VGFLYKHYEKLILAVFLLVFVFSLIYLIMVFSQSKDITVDDLQIKPEGTNYVAVFDENGKENIEKDGAEGDAAAPKGKFDVWNTLKMENEWVHSVKRNPDSLDYSDLLIPFKAARCDKCKKLIPCAAFALKKCPLCGEDPGVVKESAPEQKNTDEDNDGLPDKLERTVGLNPADPSDKWTDLDEDGFLNYTEFQLGTKLNDAKSHPPLADRLALVGIVRKRLTLRLVDVKNRDSKDKKNWLIQLKVIGKRGRATTEFKAVGDTVTLDKRKGSSSDMYIIVDADYKTVEKFDPKLKQPVEINVSTITIQNAMNSADKPIKVVIGKPVYEKRTRIALKDTLTGKVYKLKDKETFTAGDANSGTESYTVMKVDLPKKEWVEIKGKDNKIYRIGNRSQIDAIKNEAVGGVSAIQQTPDEMDSGLMMQPASRDTRPSVHGNPYRRPAPPQKAQTVELDDM